ncbi:hypothetical protein [Cryobacterium sp. Y82]|uniref:hypothetical protein n=1 Tax=Cryobacterium sp. Y82 TaxID=2045017 RepID=UPI0011B09FDB|nr:hypothetical protein [Cryobacterium sp. Y82]
MSEGELPVSHERPYLSAARRYGSITCAIRSMAPKESRLARTRWLSALSAVYVAVAVWSAIERDWFTIWAMWALLLGYLIARIIIAWRLRTHLTSLPPAWFIFALAFVTSIMARSPRDLRVEWFSLPLGIFLIAAGAVILKGARGMLRACLQNLAAGVTARSTAGQCVERLVASARPGHRDPAVGVGPGHLYRPIDLASDPGDHHRARRYPDRVESRARSARTAGHPLARCAWAITRP